MSRDIISELKAKAASDIQTIVLPETEDRRTYLAATEVLREGFARIALVGTEENVSKISSELRVRIDEAEVIDPAKSPKRAELAQQIYAKRKNKGMTLEQADALLDDYTHFAAALVASGHAGGYVSGAAHATAEVLRPALKIIGPAPGVKTVSSYFVIISPLREFGEDGVLFFADAGVVPEPTAAQMAEIAVITAKTAREIYGIEPRVGMMSFSTKGSASHPLVKKVQDATKIAKAMAPDLLLDGELQADAALVPAVAARKAPGSPVAGRVNVLIFPDLNSGNLCYKMTERLGSAQAFGPLIQGLSRPANDLSRGCSAADIVGVIAVTAAVAALEAAGS